MRGLVNLLGRLGVAFQTGLGDFGAGLEILLQFLELAMVGSAGVGRCRRRAADDEDAKRNEPADE